MKQSDIINGWRQLINPKDADYFKNKLLNLAFSAKTLTNDEINTKSVELAVEIEHYKISYKTIYKDKIKENAVQDEFGFSQDYFKTKIFDLFNQSKFNNIDDQVKQIQVNQIVDEIEQYKKSKKV